jgi:pimeloyl-ACP methyl ester carboxylesterase
MMLLKNLCHGSGTNIYQVRFMKNIFKTPGQRMNNNQKKNIFLLSGLGADERVFDFLDLGRYNTKCIEWIEPGEDERVESYARRLLDQIDCENPILMGVSFGGLIAIEIGKLIETEKIILISSIETCKDLPIHSKLFGALKLNQLIPATLLNEANDGLYWAFSIEKEDEKKLLKAIIEDSDPNFLKWGINEVLNWKNETKLSNVTTINGTDDRVFPDKEGDFIIEGGGHLMIINRSKEIDKILEEVIDKEVVPKES